MLTREISIFNLTTYVPFQQFDKNVFPFLLMQNILVHELIIHRCYHSFTHLTMHLVLLKVSFLFCLEYP